MTANDITVIILAGGLGTRLKNVVPSQPKAMAMVCNRPFLSYIMENLLLQGFNNTILCVGHLGDQIRNYFNTKMGQMTLSYSEEKILKGTAGALRQALPLIHTKYLMVFNGDSYCSTDLNSYLKWYFETEAEISLLLTRVKDVRRYGSVETNSYEQVIAFNEKPATKKDGYINAGIYLLKRDHIADIPKDREVSLEYELLQSFIGKGLFAYKTEASFLDIGTPETYVLAQSFFKHWPKLPADH